MNQDKFGAIQIFNINIEWSKHTKFFHRINWRKQTSHFRNTKKCKNIWNETVASLTLSILNNVNIYRCFQSKSLINELVISMSHLAFRTLKFSSKFSGFKIFPCIIKMLKFSLEYALIELWKNSQNLLNPISVGQWLF